jgi:large subunit ribosomal protein L29
MKVADLRNKSVAELEKELITLREEQFKSQMKKSTGQLTNSHVIQQARRDVARIKTILNEKR